MTPTDLIVKAAFILVEQIGSLIKLWVSAKEQSLTTEQVAAEISRIMKVEKDSNEAEWNVVRGDGG